MTTKQALENAGRAYLSQWLAYLRSNPDADESFVEDALSRGELPPGHDVIGRTENNIELWEKTHPVAYQIYWALRDALEDQDGKKKGHHHRVALLAIHDSFSSKTERARLQLPATTLELAALLGVSARTMRTYRHSYPTLFATTQNTMQQAFIKHYYGRVYETMGESAITLEGRHSGSDRRLFVQLAGDLVDRSEISGPGGGPVEVDDVGATDEQRIAGVVAVLERARARHDRAGTGDEGGGFAAGLDDSPSP